MTKNYDTDIIINNGRIIDGMGNPWFHSDIYINKGKITKIERDKKSTAKKELNTANLVVFPGLEKRRYK